MGFKRGTTLYEVPPRQFVPCDRVGCGVEALVRSDGMNLCVGHYETQHQQSAREYAMENGLRTPKQHIARMQALRGAEGSQGMDEATEIFHRSEDCR